MKHFFCLFFVTLLFISCSNDDKVKNNAEEETEITEPQYMYGICIDSLDVEHGVVKKMSSYPTYYWKKTSHTM